MDSGFSLIVKFGERCFARKCSGDYTREELVKFVMAKWSGLSRDEIYLSYDLLGAGELDLADEEDMSTMFRLLKESQSSRAHIYVRSRSVTANKEICVGGSSSGSDLRECSLNGNGGTCVVPMEGGIAGHKLCSDEWRTLISGPGQRFLGGAVEFRRSLIKYSVQMGFEFVFLRNGPKRVSAACSYRVEKGCPWRIHAVEDAIDGAFCISLYERNHTCGTSFGNVSRKRVNYQIVSEIIIEDIRTMPGLTPVQVIALVKKNYGFDISYCVAWKAMDRGRGVVFGDHTSSFAMLPAYFEELKSANPGSHVDLDVGDDQKFRRCFFTFQACLLGFKHCRPMIMVDETFLKGRHKGCMLSAVAKDGDQGLFPLAFAVVNEESDHNWNYFFEHLSVAIGGSRKIVKDM